MWNMAEINQEKLTEMLHKMLLTRKFEEQVAYFFSMGMVHGTTHLYVGEEASATGVCCALEPQDIITSTHRGHGHCISKGIDLNRMMAELLGKATGYCKGKGGSMHIADLDRGNLGANGVVGGGQSIAVGAALTTKLKNIDRIVVCFFGDGSTNQGNFHEAMNLASIWKLPVLFVCENNQYGISMSVKRSINIEDLSIRAQSYGMPGKRLDGNDAIAVFKAASDARNYVRSNGPMLLVLETYRYLGHSKSDANAYRTKDEIAQWRNKDPIKRLWQHLLDNGYYTEEELKAIEEKANAEIEAAVKFARESPYPSVDTIMEDVYA
jgi:acetoin:2,6-dichlorophenolindophenol oxidoreductase subunit alpha